MNKQISGIKYNKIGVTFVMHVTGDNKQSR